MSETARNLSDGAAETIVSDRNLRGLFGYRLKRAFNVIQSDLVRTLKPFELRMFTYTALVLIVDNPGLRQSQLADAMEVERPNLVAIVDELARRDLIARNRVPSDRRAYALRATTAGERLCAEATDAVQAHETSLLACLDPDMRDDVMEAMKRIENSQIRG